MFRHIPSFYPPDRLYPPPRPQTPLHAGPLDELSRHADAFAQLAAAAKATPDRACDALAAARRVGRARVRPRGSTASAAGESGWPAPLPASYGVPAGASASEVIARDGSRRWDRAFAGPGRTVWRSSCSRPSAFDRPLCAGFSGYALMQAGVDAAEARLRQARSSIGGIRRAVSLVLGAGNVSSIPPMDVSRRCSSKAKVAC